MRVPVLATGCPLNPLFRMAVIAGVESAVKIHIQRGDDLNARDVGGLTPLMLAAMRNKSGICALLLSSGADTSLTDPSGKDALAHARQVGAEAALSKIQAAMDLASAREGTTPMLDMVLESDSDLSADIPVAEPNRHRGPLNLPVSVSLDDFGNLPLMGDAKQPPPLEITSSIDLDVEPFPIEISDWEPEVDPLHGVDDPILADGAATVQISITHHTPVDSSSDWDDLDVYLPLTSAPLRRTNDAEAKATLRLLLLRAMREGSVPDAAVVDMATNVDRSENEDSEALLRMVINDLGAETDERFETADDNALIAAVTYAEESLDEEELISEAMALIDRHESNRNDPLQLYQREFQRGKLITADEEIMLAKAMESSFDKAIEILASWPAGLAHVIASSELVKSGLKPIQWFTTGARDDDQDESTPLEDGDDVVAMVVDNDEQDIDSALDQKAQPSDSESSDLFERIAALSKIAKVDRIVGSNLNETRSILASLSLKNSFLLGMLDLARSDKSVSAKQFAQVMGEHRQARDAMAEANLKLVASISKKFLYTGLPMEDLIQDGNIGLLKAVDKFDWRKGFRFSTMATWWIRQSIHRAASDTARTIRLPVHVYAIAQKLIRASVHFEQINGRPPTKVDVAEMMSLTLNKAAAFMRIAHDTESIDNETIDELISPCFVDDFSSKDPTDVISDADLTRAMDVMLSDLGRQHERIIRLRYGFGVADSLTLEEVGSMYGVTRERIRQIEAKAMRILKHPQRVEKLRGMLFGSHQPTPVTNKVANRSLDNDDIDLKIDDAPARPKTKPSTGSASVPTDFTKRVQSRRGSTFHRVMTQALEMRVDVTVDRESPSGTTWVDVMGPPDDRHRKLIRKLLAIGFKHWPGKGYWR